MKINIVFDGPPEHTTGRFVEVEDEQGYSVGVGEWLPHPKPALEREGWWVLQIEVPDDTVTR